MFDIYTYDPNQNSLLTPAIGLVGVFIGSLLSYFVSRRIYENQLQDEIKNIAKALELDIETIEKTLSFSEAYELYTKDNKYILCDDEYLYPNRATHVPPSQLYNKETGLYFLYQREITKLNYNLSLDIYKFYNELILAENDRLFISQNPYFMLHLEEERITDYRELTRLIIECGNSISKLKTELEKVQRN